MQHKKYIDCICEDIGCTLRFKFFDDETDERVHFLYIDVYLRNKKWYKRIWRGIKYIFGWRSPYGEFTEILYDTDKVKELQAFLEEYIKATPKASK